MPHRFVVSYLWEIPGPKSGVLKQILGGWQFSGITAFQSGRPFTIRTGVDSNGDGTTGSDRPNINGSCGVTWDDEHKTFTNNGCYTVPLGTNNLPLANTLGNGSAPPQHRARRASFWNTDLSLLKRFYMSGDSQLILRADAFNAFNQDTYGLPVTNLMSSTSFGQNSNNWGRRIVTLSAKFVLVCSSPPTGSPEGESLARGAPARAGAPLLSSGGCCAAPPGPPLASPE